MLFPYINNCFAIDEPHNAGSWVTSNSTTKSGSIPFDDNERLWFSDELRRFFFFNFFFFRFAAKEKFFLSKNYPKHNNNNNQNNNRFYKTYYCCQPASISRIFSILFIPLGN